MPQLTVWGKKLRSTCKSELWDTKVSLDIKDDIKCNEEIMKKIRFLDSRIQFYRKAIFDCEKCSSELYKKLTLD